MLQMTPFQGSAVCSCPQTMPTGQHQPLRPSRSSRSRTRPSLGICLRRQQPLLLPVLHMGRQQSRRPSLSICLRRQQPLLLPLLHMGRRQSRHPSLARPQLPSHRSQVCQVCGPLLDLRRAPEYSCSAATGVRVCPSAGML